MPAGATCPSTADDLILQPDKDFRTGIPRFDRLFDGTTTSLERDLLLMASAVHFYDVSHRRGMREDVARDMEMWLPVVNYHALVGQKARLELMLNVLSNDNWTLHFERAAGDQESKTDWPDSEGETLLFSGGLDSLAYAVDALDARGPASLQLASHVTRNSTTISSQRRLHGYLETKYDGTIQRVEIRTGKMASASTEEKKEAEVSQRTRSFLFLTIAALAARRRGMGRLVFIAENGQMAIHVPLSAGRIGAFSTHTAHPQFVHLASEFFSDALDFPIKVDNPYLYKTKAEVVEKLAREHEEIISVSNSCWKSSHNFNKHCGECVPCYVRRIALEHHGVKVDPWMRDMFVENLDGLPFDHDGKRNLNELGMFANDFRTLSDFELDEGYIELYNDHFDRDKAIAMYRRFADEAKGVFEKYPRLARLVR